MTSRVALAATVLMLAAVLCHPAAATTWLFDSFDSYGNGNLSGNGGWTGSSAVQVETTFALSGKSVEADRLHTNPTWGVGDAGHSVPGTAGYYYVDFDAAMDTATAIKGENLGYVKLFNSSGIEITRIYYAHQQFKALLGPANPTVIKDDVAMRSWYHIRVGVNPSDNTMDVWVDGAQVVTQGQVFNSPSVISSITFGQWSIPVEKFTKSETYLDNLVVGGEQSAQNATIVLGPRFFPGWQVFNVCYPSVFLDSADNKYKMYYSGTGFGYTNDATWDQWTTGYITSTNESKWLFPDNYEAVLFAHKFYEGDLVDAQTESAKFDSIFAYMPCVMKDGSTYKMWYTGWNGDTLQSPAHIANKVNFRIGYATSPDGIAWTKYPDNDTPSPVVNLAAYGTQDSKGVSHPSVLKKNATYHMWYEGYDGTTWRIFHTTSANGINWQTPQLVLSPGPSGSNDELNARNPVVVERSGQFEMWYEGESAASLKYHVLRATSADGVTWAKIPAQVTLHPIAPTDRPSLNVSDPVAHVLVNTVIANQDGSCTVYFAKQLTETQSTRVAPIKAKYFYIFREVVVL